MKKISYQDMTLGISPLSGTIDVECRKLQLHGLSAAQFAELIHPAISAAADKLESPEPEKA